MQHFGDRLAFDALRASLGWSGSYLRRGALMLLTADGAHRSLRGYLLAIGDTGTAGILCNKVYQLLFDEDANPISPMGLHSQ